MKRAILHVVALVALAAAVVCGVLLWRQRPWRTSVSVNGRIVTARELDMRAQLLLEDGRRTGQPPASFEDYRRQAAARWIVKELLLSESVARGVELGAEDEAFTRPAWVGAEVTGDRRYYNSMLIKCPYKDWKHSSI